jgi:uncharacterized protein YeaO (DUF488 family)
VKLLPVSLKRVYAQPSADDGMRVLVDRLWPRGLTKEEVSADLWLREVAPSSKLRRWYGHDPKRWSRFSRKYREELNQQSEVLKLLQDLRRRTPVTLIFAGRDEAHSHAVILKKQLD